MITFSFATTQPALAAPCTGTRYYVDQDATGANTGADWANALTSLQDALTSAETCPGIVEIWVAEGLYKPGATAEDTFLIREGLKVYGGFAGTETLLNQRNLAAHITVLSGDVNNNDTVDASGVITTYTNIDDPNAYHVVTFDGTGSRDPVTGNTRLDGFVVTGGWAHTGFTTPLGGGILCNGSGAGNECSPNIADVTLIGNSAEEAGGGMANVGDSGGKSKPSLNRVTLTNNYAGGAGGGMANYGGGGESSPSLTDVAFTGNTAQFGAGAMLNNGSGGVSSPTLTRVTFHKNSTVVSSASGGAMINDGQFLGSSSPTLTDVTFTENSAGRDGGAIQSLCFNGDSGPTLHRVTLTDNSAGRHGGAMAITGDFGKCSPQLNNVVVLSNFANNFGAGIYMTGFSDDSLPVFINVTFAGNVGEGLYNELESIGPETFPISNTIFYGNSTAIFNVSGFVPRIHNSLVQGSGGSGGSWVTAFGQDAGGNIDANPRFIDAANGNVRLRSDSPAVDAGDNASVPPESTLDVDGAPRIFDGNGDSSAIVDMGAFERSTFALNVTTTGTGSGSVSSTPAGITCGVDCSETLDFGTVITLTAAPNSSSLFGGWTGECSGSGACVVTVDAAKQVTATFTLKQYAIVTSASPSEGGTTTGGGTYTHGDPVTVTASTAADFVFVNWTEDDTVVSTNASVGFTAAADRTLVANFLPQFTIAVSSSPSEGGAASGAGVFTQGDTVTVMATAEPGFVFARWTEGDTVVSIDASYSFAAAANRTLVANFVRQLAVFTVETSSSPSEGGTTTGGGTVVEGDTVTVTASAASGFTFVNWTEDGAEVSTEASYSFFVISDRTLVANFAVVEDAEDKAYLPSLRK